MGPGIEDLYDNAFIGLGAGRRRRRRAAGLAGFREPRNHRVRAPYLSTNGHLSAALRETGHSYDASGVSRGPSVPRTSSRLSAFDLPLIPEGPSNRRIIAMDYNLFVRHSAGIENRSDSDRFEARSYAAFRRAFDKQFNGKRLPLQIGLHFVEMNGGGLLARTERLLSEVCGEPEVACVTYQEALRIQKAREKGSGA